MATKRKPTRRTATRTARPAKVVMPVCEVAESVGGELHKFPLTEGDTVGSVFAKAGIETPEGIEILNSSGADVKASDLAVAGETYYISKKYISKQI